MPAGSRFEHRHLQVAADSWALARAVARLDVEAETVRDARVVIGAVLGSPHRLAGAETALVGRPAQPGLADTAASAFDGAGVRTIDDV